MHRTSGTGESASIRRMSNSTARIRRRLARLFAAVGCIWNTTTMWPVPLTLSNLPLEIPALGEEGGVRRLHHKLSPTCKTTPSTPEPEPP
ncbi:hypothetical protein PYCCODRAFT_708045 [Trametes coccinea BRFM310]|uniref:Uncharacterized protein n=1 Tax=Trametes coccinea (strain BRFM310) TaxID=1353009 RepID=A0A1Y2IGD5_TRAC3|nr:hypothetical protein PYCCODRAFT_708045 [Trametes coccinea BRFM310]